MTLLTDAIRGVELEPGDSDRALSAMIEAGAEPANFASVRSGLLANGNAANPAGGG